MKASVPSLVTAGARQRPAGGSGVSLSALGALFWLSLRQHCRARRLLVLAFLFTLPSLVAVLTRYAQRPPPALDVEFVLIFTLIPNALVPLTALLYASGMIQDEIEEQTLTYLLVRPLPKWAIYLVKLVATLLITVLLAAVFTTLAYVALYAGTADLWGTILPGRVFQTVCLLALALVGYCCLFGCLSLFARRSLLVGVVYIFVFEGLLANVDFVVRRLTVMYYFRVLEERWLGLFARNLDPDFLAKSPTSAECVSILLIASLALTVIAAIAFTTREFRVKTPEGS
ncbi:MAG TPA: ABC transporter permease [Gemmataceae bacterium]|jgi:ABC-2 type transport system permease protein|nr:ABC transporter permease [Gemmataceae bacterium]